MRDHVSGHIDRIGVSDAELRTAACRNDRPAIGFIAGNGAARQHKCVSCNIDGAAVTGRVVVDRAALHRKCARFDIDTTAAAGVVGPIAVNAAVVHLISAVL